jgi:hypothetical protein
MTQRGNGVRGTRCRAGVPTSGSDQRICDVMIQDAAAKGVGTAAARRRLSPGQDKVRRRG